MFRAVAPKGIIRDIALGNVAIIAVSLAPNGSAAPLVATNDGKIVNASATGSIDATRSHGSYAGLGRHGQQEFAYPQLLVRRLNYRRSRHQFPGRRPRRAQSRQHRQLLRDGHAHRAPLWPGSSTLNAGPGVSIVGSHATAALVFPPGSTTSGAGGLVYLNEGSISNSYASCSFTGNLAAGVMAGAGECQFGPDREFLVEQRHRAGCRRRRRRPGRAEQLHDREFLRHGKIVVGKRRQRHKRRRRRSGREQ